MSMPGFAAGPTLVRLLHVPPGRAPRPLVTMAVGSDLLAISAALTLAAVAQRRQDVPALGVATETLLPLALAGAWLVTITALGGYAVVGQARLERLVLVVASGLTALVAWVGWQASGVSVTLTTYVVALGGGTVALPAARALRPGQRRPSAR